MLSRCSCVSVCHTSTQTQVRTHPRPAAGARALKMSYHRGAHVQGCGCLCEGRKEAVGSVEEKTELPAPLVPAAFVQMKFQMLLVSCQQIFCKINGSNYIYIFKN